ALLPRIAAVRERELGDLDGAIAAWEGVLAASPDDPAALEALARLYAAAERSEPLVEVLRRAAAAVEGEARAALLMQAADVCALALEDSDRAVPLCREALLAVPDHLPALEMLALHLREDTDRDELVAVLERLALRLPEGSEARADALLRRAHLLTRLGATDGAVRCCEQVLAERPGED